MKVDLTQFEGHTPGPWWDESGVVHAKHPKLWTEKVHSCEHVCSVTSDRADQDGELISAAPDILAYARELEERNKELEDAVETEAEWFTEQFEIPDADESYRFHCLEVSQRLREALTKNGGE